MKKTKHGFKLHIYLSEKSKQETLLNGENVILQAPTGAGKTLAAIMPYNIAKEEGLNFPQKLIYSTPRRTLVNSLYEDIYKEINEGKFSTKFNITVRLEKEKKIGF